MGSIFPLSAFRNKLSFERRERAPFKQAQVPRKILPMHPSALNGARNKMMAQVQHGTEIQRPRHLPGIRWRRTQPHKAKFGPLPAKSFSETDFDTRSFRYTQGDCPCSLSFHGAAFDVIPLGVFQGKITSRGPCNANQAAMSCSIVEIVARYRFLDERANVAVSLIWNIQPEGLFFTACWLPLFNEEISRSNSWESPLRVAAMYTASTIILWTILYGIPANAVDPTEARSPIPLAGMARCWTSAIAVVDPVGRWRSKP